MIVENNLRGEKLKMPLAGKQRKVENEGEWQYYVFEVENDQASKKIEKAPFMVATIHILKMT